MTSQEYTKALRDQLELHATGAEELERLGTVLTAALSMFDAKELAPNATAYTLKDDTDAHQLYKLLDLAKSLLDESAFKAAIPEESKAIEELITQIGG